MERRQLILKFLSALRRSLLPWAVAIAAFIAGSPAYAQAEVAFGRTTQGVQTSGGLSANFKRASRFSLSEAGTVHTMCAYVDGKGGASGTQGFRLALYSDSSGVPANKIAETGTLQVSAGAQADWLCAFFYNKPITAGTYWIAIQSSDTAGVIRDYFDGAANWYGNADTYSDGASDVFGTGNAGQGTLSVYAVYYPDSELRNAGRMTIGTNPSAGMTADYKRGSSFVMTEPGQVRFFNTYYDTLGSSAGGQSMRVLIYRDNNGVPGDLVYGNPGSPGSTPAGQPPQWHSINAPVLYLDPGRYWYVLQTGPTGGVLRNYSDGAGNWYGGADTFADGPSKTFGPGGSGNGTISGFISYLPGAPTIRQFGRSSVAATPSGGLTANTLRGSRFTMPDKRSNLTALYAYLDGNGGAAGSQKVRMTVYGVNFDTSSGQTVATAALYAQSDEVTIAAGTPPGWVQFPVYPKTLGAVTDQFYIMLQTGDTAGVIRDYGDGAANWTSVPDSYADGPSFSFIVPNGGTPTGNVTLSVYGTYALPRE